VQIPRWQHPSSFTLRVGIFLTLVLGMAAAPPHASAQLTFSLVSVATDGTQGNGQSEGSSVSADGRFVAFSSLATNLVANDANNSWDVFVRDRQTNTTTRVSVTTAGEERNGNSRSAKISADGRYVVFQSGAPLVANDDNMCSAGPTCEDVYLHDRQTGTTERLSVSTAGAQGNQDSSGPSMSADARFVAFTSSASNLVDNDTNADVDVFLRDTQADTTIRVSLMTDGSQNPARSSFGIISADGSAVTFGSTVPSTAFPTPQPCRDNAACPATFVYQREQSSVVLLSAAYPFTTFPHSGIQGEVPVAISADGRVVVIEQRLFGQARFESRRSVVYDRVTGQTIVGLANLIIPPSLPLEWHSAISPDGRYVVQQWTYPDLFKLVDRVSGHVEGVHAPTVPNQPSTGQHAFSANSRFIAFDASGPVLDSDANNLADVYIVDRDGDNDGVPGGWEATFGTDFAVADAGLDPDGDGVTNLEEYQRGSHPNGTFKRYLAEGAVNAFFSTSIAAMNPNVEAASVLFQFQGTHGVNRGAFRTLQGRTRTTLDLQQFREVPENDFATVIESNRPIVVDRTMRWDSSFVGAHAETAIESPATTWYLAEGATHGNFDLFYLIQNPGDAAARVQVRYLLPAPATPLVASYDVLPHSRFTLPVDAEPGLAATDVGATITSDQPIIVERAMYASPNDQVFAAGHEGAAIKAPAPRWFLAEGATGSFFDLYILVANPNSAESKVDVTYLLPNDPPFTKPYTIGPEGRLTISVETEDPRLADTPVAAIVETTNNQPIVVERAMWWPSPNWYEAHLSAGSTTTGTRWGLAEGGAANGAAFPVIGDETYVLIANVSPTAGSAKITLVDDTGVFLEHTVELKPSSRVNVPIGPLLPAGTGKRFGAIVESNGVELVVERAMYWSTNGVTWSAGTAALATKLQ
jgi:hypothetical protein